MCLRVSALLLVYCRVTVTVEVEVRQSGTKQCPLPLALESRSYNANRCLDWAHMNLSACDECQRREVGLAATARGREK